MKSENVRNITSINITSILHQEILLVDVIRAILCRTDSTFSVKFVFAVVCVRVRALKSYILGFFYLQ